MCNNGLTETHRAAASRGTESTPPEAKPQPPLEAGGAEGGGVRGEDGAAPPRDPRGKGGGRTGVRGPDPEAVRV